MAEPASPASRYRNDGDYKRAEATYLRLIAEDPKNRMHYLLGLAKTYEQAGQFDEAEAQYREYLQSAPSDPKHKGYVGVVQGSLAELPKKRAGYVPVQDLITRFTAQPGSDGFRFVTYENADEVSSSFDQALVVIGDPMDPATQLFRRQLALEATTQNLFFIPATSSYDQRYAAARFDIHRSNAESFPYSGYWRSGPADYLPGGETVAFKVVRDEAGIMATRHGLSPVRRIADRKGYLESVENSKEPVLVVIGPEDEGALGWEETVRILLAVQRKSKDFRGIEIDVLGDKTRTSTLFDRQTGWKSYTARVHCFVPRGLARGIIRDPRLQNELRQGTGPIQLLYITEGTGRRAVLTRNAVYVRPEGKPSNYVDSVRKAATATAVQEATVANSTAGTTLRPGIEKALEELRAAQATGPTDDDRTAQLHWEALKLVKQALGARPGPAGAIFERAMEIDPGFNRPLFAYAEYLFNKGNYKAVERLIGYVPSDSPRQGERYWLGRALVLLGRWEEGTELLNKYLEAARGEGKDDPYASTERIATAERELTQGKRVEARRLLSQAIKALASGDGYAAVGFYDGARELDPKIQTGSRQLKAVVLGNEAERELRDGRVERAADLYGQARNLGWRGGSKELQANALAVSADRRLMEGRGQEATRLYRQARVKLESVATTARLDALVAWKSGDHNGALDHYKRGGEEEKDRPFPDWLKGVMDRLQILTGEMDNDPITRGDRNLQGVPTEGDNFILLVVGDPTSPDASLLEEWTNNAPWIVHTREVDRTAALKRFGIHHPFDTPPRVYRVQRGYDSGDQMQFRASRAEPTRMLSIESEQVFDRAVLKSDKPILLMVESGEEAGIESGLSRVVGETQRGENIPYGEKSPVSPRLSGRPVARIAYLDKEQRGLLKLPPKSKQVEPEPPWPQFWLFDGPVGNRRAVPIAIEALFKGYGFDDYEVHRIMADEAAWLARNETDPLAKIRLKNVEERMDGTGSVFSFGATKNDEYDFRQAIMLVHQARKLSARGDRPEAQKLLKQAIRTDPECVAAATEMARLHYNNGNWTVPEAQQVVTLLEPLKEGPRANTMTDYCLTQGLLGLAYAKLGKGTEAKPLLESFVAYATQEHVFPPGTWEGLDTAARQALTSLQNP